MNEETKAEGRLRRKVDKGSLELTFYKPPADVERCDQPVAFAVFMIPLGKVRP